MKAYRTKYKVPAHVHTAMKIGRPTLRRATRPKEYCDTPRSANSGTSGTWTETITPREFVTFQEVDDTTLPSEPKCGDAFLPPSGLEAADVTPSARIFPCSPQDVPSLPRAGVARARSSSKSRKYQSFAVGAVADGSISMPLKTE